MSDNHMQTFWWSALGCSTIPESVQHRIFDVAAAAKDYKFLAVLAAHPSLCDEVDGKLSKIQSAKVVTAWASRPGRTSSDLMDKVRAEKRVTVLEAIAKIPGLDDVVYLAMVDKASKRTLERFIGCEFSAGVKSAAARRYVTEGLFGSISGKILWHDRTIADVISSEPALLERLATHQPKEIFGFASGAADLTPKAATAVFSWVNKVVRNIDWEAFVDSGPGIYRSHRTNRITTHSVMEKLDFAGYERVLEDLPGLLRSYELPQHLVENVAAKLEEQLEFLNELRDNPPQGGNRNFGIREAVTDASVLISRILSTISEMATGSVADTIRAIDNSGKGQRELLALLACPAPDGHGATLYGSTDILGFRALVTHLAFDASVARQLIGDRGILKQMSRKDRDSIYIAALDAAIEREDVKTISACVLGSPGTSGPLTQDLVIALVKERRPGLLGDLFVEIAKTKATPEYLGYGAEYSAFDLIGHADAPENLVGYFPVSYLKAADDGRARYQASMDAASLAKAWQFIDSVLGDNPMAWTQFIALVDSSDGANSLNKTLQTVCRLAGLSFQRDAA